jgi:creatinine amidohydrolase
VSDLITLNTAKDEAERQAHIAVLPIGSFEQHGDYLPLATDTLIACIIANELARAYPMQVLPPVTIACSHEHAAWRGTVSISARTLCNVIVDVAASLRKSGIQRLVVVNGHGGNYVLANIVQEASVDEPAMALFPAGLDWHQARVDAGMETSSHEDMHAGELETSILLSAMPHVVRPGYETGDWLADDRRHLLTLGVSEYTKSGVIGRPSAATAEKGTAALASLVRSFADTLSVLERHG